MLLIDGVKYILWTPKDEKKEFHPMVRNCSKEIFGEDSVYFDVRHKLSSKSGIAAVPDAYVITLSKPYEWYIVENELASHPVYSHIVPQISKFVDSIEELETQRDIRDILDKEVNEDVVLKAFIEKKTGQDSYRFLTELVSKPPKIALIIDKKTPEVEKASKSLNKLAGTRIIEFQTFSREDAPNVHAHLFEPLHVTEKVSEECEREEAIRKKYTESYHLKNVAKDIISVYEKIKNAMLKLDSSIKINPQKYYISLRKNKNFAYITLRKKYVNIVVMLSYKDGSNLSRNMSFRHYPKASKTGMVLHASKSH